MKILFISNGDFPDLQSDMILHGLKSLFGKDVIDVNQCWYMYKDLKEKYWDERIPNNGKSYGMGFTISGLLDNLDIDRTNIKERIYNKEFDFIIFGSIQRCKDNLDLVLKCYPKEKIIFIDGQDQTDIIWELVDNGIYCKRELIYNNENIFPINFCIPKEKIYIGETNKNLKLATIIPGNLETYIYDNELDYYKGYQDAYFGMTFRKGGWDCLRHYEILMNKCIPYFINIEKCPKRTLTLFPKDLCIEVNNLINENKITDDNYYDLLTNFLYILKNNLTTIKVAEQILNYTKL
jgi:hypothetical protein